MNKINRILESSALRTAYHLGALIVVTPAALIGIIRPSMSTLLFTSLATVATVMNIKYLNEARKVKL